jgi:hypothetical protein
MNLDVAQRRLKLSGQLGDSGRLPSSIEFAETVANDLVPKKRAELSESVDGYRR